MSYNRRKIHRFYKDVSNIFFLGGSLKFTRVVVGTNSAINTKVYLIRGEFKKKNIVSFPVEVGNLYITSTRVPLANNESFVD